MYIKYLKIFLVILSLNLNILGYKSANYIHSPTHCNVYFSPDNGLSNILVDFINSEKENIKIAIYILTNKSIAKALSKAKKRGINIELIIDSYCLESSAIYEIIDNQIPVHIFSPEKYNIQMSESDKNKNNKTKNEKRWPAIMHNKFCIFSKNKNNESLVWTGSFNFTYQADSKNQENAIVLYDKSQIERFKQQFELLKKRSIKYSDYKLLNPHPSFLSSLKEWLENFNFSNIFY